VTRCCEYLAKSRVANAGLGEWGLLDVVLIAASGCDIGGSVHKGNGVRFVFDEHWFSLVLLGHSLQTCIWEK